MENDEVVSSHDLCHGRGCGLDQSRSILAGEAVIRRSCRFHVARSDNTRAKEKEVKDVVFRRICRRIFYCFSRAPSTVGVTIARGSLTGPQHLYREKNVAAEEAMLLRWLFRFILPIVSQTIAILSF